MFWIFFGIRYHRAITCANCQNSQINCQRNSCLLPKNAEPEIFPKKITESNFQNGNFWQFEGFELAKSYIPKATAENEAELSWNNEDTSVHHLLCFSCSQNFFSTFLRLLSKLLFLNNFQKRIFTSNLWTTGGDGATSLFPGRGLPQSGSESLVRKLPFHSDLLPVEKSKRPKIVFTKKQFFFQNHVRRPIQAWSLTSEIKVSPIHSRRSLW